MIKVNVSPSLMAIGIGCKRAPMYKKLPSLFDSGNSHKGDYAHEVMESLVKKKEIPEPKEKYELSDAEAAEIEANTTDAYQRIMEIEGIKAIGAEVVLTSVKGSADIVLVTEDTIYIIDLKYSMAPPAAKNNKQLLTYALGVIDKLGKVPTKPLNLCILNGMTAELDAWEVSADEIHTDFRAVWEATQKADYELEPATAGLHCTYCKANHQCKTFIGAMAEFKDVNLIDQPGVALRLLKAGTKSLEALKVHIRNELTAGNKVEGAKLVKPRLQRSLNKKKIQELELELGAGIWDKPKPKSPAQLDKLFPENIELIAEATLKGYTNPIVKLADEPGKEWFPDNHVTEEDLGI